MPYLSPSYIRIKLKVGHLLSSLLSVNVLVAQLWQLRGIFDDSINLLLGLSDLPNLLSARFIILNSSTGWHLWHFLTFVLLELRICKVITTFS